MRVGIGFDVHAFDPARPLVLGGVTIPDAPGLAGHSDADVVCHAIADALLGATALGDIGEHFPDADPAFAGASSIDLLRSVVDMVRERALRVANVDVTVLLEVPKIAPYRDDMRARIAAALGVATTDVSVKASTTERLGTVGRGEGAACLAVALLVDR